MPKLKDLGINAIPILMQPPAIGDGGGGCGCTPTPDKDEPPQVCEDCNTTNRGDEEKLCVDCSTTDQCSRKQSPDKGQKNASGFSPDAISQLKQQLESHLGNQV